MKKRALSFLLVFAMMLGLLPISAMATDVTLTDTVFVGLENKATVAYSSDKWTAPNEGENEFVSAMKGEETCIKSNSYHQGYAKVHTNITIAEGIEFGNLSFDYWVSSEGGYKFYDGLSVCVNDGTALKQIYGIAQTDWDTMTIPVSSGDVVTLSYMKDSSGDGGDDCVYLKNFQFAPLHTLTFDVTPSNAKIILTDSEGDEVGPTNDETVYALEAGTYNYEIKSFGYETVTGSVSMDGDKTETVELVQHTSYAVNFNVTLPKGFPETQTIVIKHDDDVMSAEIDGTYSLVPADYSYEVTHDQCETISGTFTVVDENQTIDVPLVRKWVVADFFTNIPKITATAGEDYGFVLDKDDPTILVSNNAKQKNSSAILNLTVSEAKRLSCQYKVISDDYNDEFSITKGDEILLSEKYKVASWKDFVVDLAAGDSIQIGYSFGQYNMYGSYYAYLKNFTLTDVYALTFTDVTEGATIVLKDDDNNEIEGEDGAYWVKAGTYSYEITKFGYISKTGIATITDEAIAINGSLEQSASYDIAFAIALPDNLNTADIEVTVKYGREVMTANEDGTYTLPNGTYTYEITHPNCEKISGELVVGGDDVTVNKTMIRKKVFSDFFDGIVGITASTNQYTGFEPVKDGEDDVLASNTQDSDNSNATVTINATNGGMLSFDYKVSSESGYDEFKVFLNGVSKLKKSGEVPWTNHSIMLAVGDIVELKYCKDSSGENGQDTTWLKNFAFEKVATVTFENVDTDAVFTLKNSANATMNGTDFAYDLVAGEYTYTITKFGYEDVSDTVTVTEADQTITVDSMTALPTVNLSFDTDDGATIVVKYGADTMTATEGVYRLPTGSYSYEISKPNHVTASGTVDLQVDTIITKALVFAGEAWDGTTKTEPEQISGIYQIQYGSDFAWFADQIETGANKTICGILTKDINLNSKPWNSIGTHSNQFAGILDGAGFTISGLKSSLFDTIATTGTVKNLTVNGNITGSGNVGGIAGTNNGKISNCAFTGSVTTTSASYGSHSTGGIAGRTNDAAAVIENCANYGTISNTETLLSVSDLSVAGIVGYTGGTITNCYNLGTISASTTHGNRIGGIAGALYADGTMTNIYNAGTVTGAQVAAVVCENAGTVANAYYLENGIAGFDENTGTATIEAKTAGEMKQSNFVFALGDGFNMDSEPINSGYPVLDWQGGSVPELSQDAKDILAAKEVLVLTGLPALDSENKYPITNATTVILPAAGILDTTITWASNNALINAETGAISIPESNTAEVTLTATIMKGTESATKEFVFLIWSVDAQHQVVLDEISAKFESYSNTIQPLQAYGHTNVTQAMVQWLYRNDYVTSVIDTEIAVAFNAQGDATNEPYLSDTGVITYYTGAGPLQTHQRCNNVVLTLTYGNVTKDVTLDVNIGWDEAAIIGKLDTAIERLNWDTIKGGNENTATEIPNDFNRTNTVAGQVTEDLTLPYTLADYPEVTIKWSSMDSDALWVEDNLDGTFTAHLNRPAKGAEPRTFLLTAKATFNRLNDYMITEATNSSTGVITDWYESVKNFEITIAPSDKNDAKKIQQALDENFIPLLKDYVTEEAININAIDGDFRFPQPSAIESAGIFTDRYNQKVTFTNDNEDLVQVNGYRTCVYRPVVGEENATANITVTVADRGSGLILGTKTFAVTVLPLTQSEMDAARDMMETVATSDVYWDGLKGENTDKNAVTENLANFAEIHVDELGTITYIRGAIHATAEGIDVDDLPGYDPMVDLKWREFRSSRPTVIEHEVLRVTRPEYDTAVTIDSVFTHNELGKYYAKDPVKYADFAEFYKQPISVALVVKGTVGVANPTPKPDTLTVKVSIDGKGFEHFHSAAIKTFTKQTNTDPTAWDVLKSYFDTNGYTYRGAGSYISAVTDKNGVTLEELEYGANSGWLYTINGSQPEVNLASYYLKDGDVLKLFYTGDYVTEPSRPSSSSNKVEKPVKAENFTDLSQQDWFYDSVEFVVNSKLFTGVSMDRFAPNDLMSREMVMTVLHRLSGDKTVKPTENWAEAGITWAVAMGLTDGTNPDHFITREQIITMLYRYAKADAVEVDLSSYDDADMVSTWACEAMRWAVQNGIIKGTSLTTLNPTDTATRAEVATLMMRFVQLMG